MNNAMSQKEKDIYYRDLKRVGAVFALAFVTIFLVNMITS